MVIRWQKRKQVRKMHKTQSKIEYTFDKQNEEISINELLIEMNR